jgi:uncharacterized membrane protein YtjA (UPF0391 family)
MWRRTGMRHARLAGRRVGRFLRVVGESTDGRRLSDPARFPHETRGLVMLYYAVVFFVVALIAAVFGFSGIAAGAAGVAKILFVLFLIGAVITFFISLGRRA